MEGKITLTNYKLILKLGKNSYPLNIELGRKLTPEDIDGYEILEDEYYIENGQLIWIKIIDNKYFNNMPNRNNNFRNRQNNPQNQARHQNPVIATEYAKSPYNFVPLNKTILQGDEEVPFNIYHPERFTGYIDLTIKNLTPIFIRGINENFFKIKVDGMDKDAIPGSSIRGLVKTMVEILTYGKFENFDNAKYFMRFIADPTGRSYKKHYYEKMGLSEDRNVQITHKTKAGFLTYNHNDFSYSVYPGTGTISNIPYENKKDFSHEFATINQVTGWKVFSGNMRTDGLDKKQYFIPESHSNNPIKIDAEIIRDYNNDKTRKISKLNLLKLARNEVGNDKIYKVGVPIFYNNDVNGKVTSIGHTKNYRIPYDNYTKDLVTQEEIENIDVDFSSRIFGKSTTGEKKQPENKDISGRVFFEDAIIQNQPTDADYIYEIPKILSSPKPTSFQLYLQQKNGNPKSFNIDLANLVHWDTENAEIRGYKLYWHRVTTKDNEYSWFEKGFKISGANFNKFRKINNIANGTFSTYNNNGLSFVEYPNGDLKEVILQDNFSKLNKNLQGLLYKIFYPENFTQSAPIKAIPENNIFTGRIRFENLSEKELGALLTAIDLSKNCCHKIGMGKPLGLGTVKIESTLVLSGRKERYTTLFNENGSWAEPPLREDKNKAYFINAFTDFIIQNIDNTKKEIWEIERLTHLKSMLEFDPVKMASAAWLKKTNYMILDDFRKRNVLPNSTELKEL